MTRLLVSVRDAAEARLAVEAGVDLIDLKEPNRGPLGAVDYATMREVVEAVAGQAPLSAALGELVELSLDSVAALPKGLTYAKVGLAHCANFADWPERLAAVCRQLPHGIAPVGVIYADRSQAGAPPADEVLSAAVQLNCRALLIDTFDKTAGDLFAHLDDAELGRTVTTARQAGLLVVLAGSLSLDSLPRAMALETDYVAVRGAVCSGPRTGKLDVRKLHEFAAEVAAFRPRRSAGESESGRNDTVLAGRIGNH
jgi:uncharacterized protein (UPF0264 family)